MVPRFAAWIGRTGAELTWVVETGHLRRFAEAAGETDPMYFDEAAALVAGHRAIPALPTFAVALRAPDPREGLDLDWHKLLHAEQELLLDRTIYAGDRITVVGRMAEAWVKEGKSGTLDFLTIETVGTDSDGRRVFASRSTVAVRR